MAELRRVGMLGTLPAYDHASHEWVYRLGILIGTHLIGYPRPHVNNEEDVGIQIVEQLNIHSGPYMSFVVPPGTNIRADNYQIVCHYLRNLGDKFDCWALIGAANYLIRLPSLCESDARENVRELTLPAAQDQFKAIERRYPDMAFRGTELYGFLLSVEPTAENLKDKVIGLSKALNVLFVSPEHQRSPLQVGSEYKKLDLVRLSSSIPRALSLQEARAPTFGEFQRKLQESDPDIIHFAGHGSETGLFFQRDDRTAHLVPADVFTMELKTASKRQLRCVILNACYSARHVQRAAHAAGQAIGMIGIINDSHAIQFTFEIYHRIGSGSSLEESCRSTYVEFLASQRNLLPVLCDRTEEVNQAVLEQWEDYVYYSADQKAWKRLRLKKYLNSDATKDERACHKFDEEEWMKQNEHRVSVPEKPMFAPNRLTANIWGIQVVPDDLAPLEPRVLHGVTGPPLTHAIEGTDSALDLIESLPPALDPIQSASPALESIESAPPVLDSIKSVSHEVRVNIVPATVDTPYVLLLIIIGVLLTLLWTRG